MAKEKKAIVPDLPDTSISGDAHSIFDELTAIPVAFHAAYARIAGSISAGLFLSQAVFIQKSRIQKSTITDERGIEHAGFWYHSRQQWEEETHMTRWEQEAARKALIERKLLQEALVGLPAKLYFRINLNRVKAAVIALSAKKAGPEGDGGVQPTADQPPTSRQLAHQQDGGSTANLQGVEPPTLESDEESDQRVCAAEPPHAADNAPPSQQEILPDEAKSPESIGLFRVEDSNEENTDSKKANQKPRSPAPQKISSKEKEKPHARPTRRVKRQPLGGPRHGHRAAGESKTRDANLDHAAVRAYRDICHSTPNALQRADIVAAVGDMETWEDILRQFMREGRPPHRVDWALERYGKVAGTHGQPVARQQAERASLPAQASDDWLNVSEDQLREMLNQQQQIGGAR
jgi:hypothetical protein